MGSSRQEVQLCNCCENSCEVLLELAEGVRTIDRVEGPKHVLICGREKKQENGGNNISICEIGKQYQDQLQSRSKLQSYYAETTIESDDILTPNFSLTFVIQLELTSD